MIQFFRMMTLMTMTKPPWPFDDGIRFFSLLFGLHLFFFFLLLQRCGERCVRLILFGTVCMGPRGRGLGF